MEFSYLHAMGMHAYIAYSIPQSDAHMVYELGDLMERQGFTAVYDAAHPEHPRAQHAYDAVALSGMFVGLITGGAQIPHVVQLYQYARSQGIPAVIMREQGVGVPTLLMRDPEVIVFRRFMPENPIRRIELWISHVLR